MMRWSMASGQLSVDHDELLAASQRWTSLAQELTEGAEPSSSAAAFPSHVAVAALHATVTAVTAGFAARVAETAALTRAAASNYETTDDANASHIQAVDNHSGNDPNRDGVCDFTEHQKDLERGLVGAVASGAIIGGITAAETGPGAAIGALVGGALGGIGYMISEAETGGAGGCQ